MANTKSKKTKKSSTKIKAATVAKTDEAEKAKKSKAAEAETKKLNAESPKDTAKEFKKTDESEVEETEDIEVAKVEEAIVVEEVEDDSDDSDDYEEEDDDEDEEESEDEDDKTVASKVGNPFRGFFAKKCDKTENILTIFKTPRIWGAVLGEVIGTMLLTTILLTLGIYQPLYVMFGIIAVTMAVYAFSGAHLNPIVTAGMMATRRVSAIRGILYIVAQIVGAWFALLLVNAFRINGGDAAAELPTIVALTNETLWTCIFIELVGAIIIGYFFTRAQSYRSPRNTFTYAAIVAGGVMLAVLFGIVISGNFFSLQNNFIMNPAVAIMYQIFPTTAEDFGSLMGQIALSGATYIIIPMIGGILGSFLSDVASKLSGEDTCCGKCPCKK